jgi:dienelactone hydrolase
MIRLVCVVLAMWMGGLFGVVMVGASAWSEGWLGEYFRTETERLEGACFDGLETRAAWEAERGERRRQLLEMLGLWPMPERTPLEPVVTGRLEDPEFSVEKLHFQSRPGLYVTANLYVPRGLARPAPAVLYVCGHAQVRTNGVSCGNKTAYQHHGIWFARNGYVAMLIDTMQLGEIEGLHHGTYREGMWWWNARGYSPAGVEAWNAIRALDYLETRPEVDAERIGMTGRSGGGSYTWTTAAIDERVRVAAPVAGITDLRNQVVDGVVSGHCDCMFFVNTYEWDFPLNAALVAPRPLLMVNTDADSIFPLDGVMRTHAKVRGVYEWYGQSTNLGLVIAPGPHRDTQDLQVPVFRWFNRHLKGEDPPIEQAALRRFDPMDLRVFGELPADERNTRVHEWFVPVADAAGPPVDLGLLRRQCFAGWPAEGGPGRVHELWRGRAGRVRLRSYEFESQPGVRLGLWLAELARGGRTRSTVVEVLGANEWTAWYDGVGALFRDGIRPDPDLESVARVLDARMRRDGSRLVWLAPRGVGLTAWQADARMEVHIRRRFMLLGQTLEGMRVWDVRSGLAALRQIEGARMGQVTLVSAGSMGVNALYAALLGTERVEALELSGLPLSHREGPDYLNVLRWMDIPEALLWARGQGIEVRY